MTVALGIWRSGRTLREFGEWASRLIHGFFSNRGVGVAVTSIAVIAAGFGIAPHGGAPIASPPTTTTTVPSGTTTTSSTIPATGCAAPGIANNAFPCSTNTGAPSVGLTAYTGSTTITSCVTIDHKIISGGLDIKATNGTHPIYGTEAAAIAGACVKITNSIINMGSCSGNCADIATGYADGATGGVQCTQNNVPGAAHVGCGPVYVADTELHSVGPTGGTCSTTAQCVTAGYTNFNVHAWRVYIHGGTTGGQCEGACEMYDSAAYADQGSGDNLTHMDGFITGGNSPSCCGNLPIILDHNTISCGSTTNQTDCSAPTGIFGDFSVPSNITLNRNYFINVNKASFVCNSYAQKALVVSQIHYTNGVYDLNCLGPSPNGMITNWYAGLGNTWCNNRDVNGARATSAQFAPPNPDQC